MDNRLFFLINMARHCMFKFAEAQSNEKLNISISQAAALMFIEKNEGCQQKQLSKALALNHSAITGLVSRMEKNNLISRQPCNEDGRASRLHLTSLGSSKLPLIFPLIRSLNEVLTEDFTIEEISTITKFLNHVLEKFHLPEN